ncbi:hypothetical protein [Isoptericola cucumis]|uniref:Uncharacterized protein n=1 Tax=Isoptericola cucumis TaxID=1776856 RepID=A0ABQ2B2E5_9MICO|nr:hypothetical protein [Isoptericola cucumis]GGI04582.1 hypothetical protein GCM10007368_01880 [Isoptericola cucumis]
MRVAQVVTATDLQPPGPSPSVPWWVERAAPAAAGWAVVYGALVLSWGLGNDWGRPFGDADLPTALLGGLAALCAAAAVAALMTVRVRPGAVRPGLAGTMLWVFAGVLVTVAPGTLTLDLASVFTGHFDAIDWPPFLVKLFAVLGGVLFAGAAVSYRRRLHGACGYCGRFGGSSGERRRWEKAAGYAAVVVPTLGYALPHVLWAIGVPFGVTTKGAAEFSAPETAPALWGLALLAVAAAVLTLGLVMSWGETVPRWIPLVGGRTVPRLLAVIPPLVVAAAITPYGVLGTVAMTAHVTGIHELSAERMGEMEPLGFYITYLTFAAWGATLCAAAVMYHYRTRGACAHCDGHAGLPTTASPSR